MGSQGFRNVAPQYWVGQAHALPLHYAENLMPPPADFAQGCCQDGLVIPNNVFRAVPDAISGTWDGRTHRFCLHAEPTPLIRPLQQDTVDELRDCIILIVESPHKCEFCPDDTPRWPLAAEQVRGELDAHLGCQIDAAIRAAGNLVIQCAQVVFVNPVPFQASLASLMTENEYNQPRKIQQNVRNAVWMAMFNYRDICDNYVIRNDFGDRIRNYRPKLVLSAPTGGLCKTGQARQQTIRAMVEASLV